MPSAAGGSDAAPLPPNGGSIDAGLAAATARIAAVEALPFRGAFTGATPLLLTLPGVLLGGSVAAVLRGGDAAAIATGASAGLAAVVLLLVVAFLLLRRKVRRLVGEFAAAVSIVERIAERHLRDATAARRLADRALDEALAAEAAAARAKYEPLGTAVRERLQARLSQLQQIAPRHLERAAAKRVAAIAAADAERDGARTQVVQLAANHREEAERVHRDAAASRERKLALETQANAHRWRAVLDRAAGTLSSLEGAARSRSLPWRDAAWDHWSGGGAPGLPIWLGTLALPVGEITTPLAEPEPHPLLAASPIEMPLLLDLPGRGGVLVECGEPERAAALSFLQAAALRVLTTLPPGKVRFTLIDPVGLGANFAGLMHAADEDERIVGDRIWTEARHVEQRLGDLTEHMETVIQKYLRNEFPSIDAYNLAAGEIAEPYRVLVFTDLPTGLTDTSAKRLASIVESGARCGVLPLLMRDLRRPLPPTLDEAELRRGMLLLRPGGDGSLRLAEPGLDSLTLHLDEPPPAERLQSLAIRAGRASRESAQVQVPFETIAPGPSQRWSLDSAPRLAVPLGRAGATRLQQLVLGEGTAQHALIAGKTGSGKSTLLHALVTNLCAWYSPDQVQLYLIDFKKGVEFKAYAACPLPHFRAVAVESDREFGLSVLQGLDVELKRRGDLFRAAGVQDLKGFRAARPSEPMPRTLLVVDEFQELFVEDDRVGQEASLLLDRIARQGRAFGIHAVLGSQTLGGAYSIARTTMGQMGVRIALQCSEADASMILSDDNTAARLLSRPGEAIYNDAGGLVEGNSPFQVVWLPDEVRDATLQSLSSLARERGFAASTPIVFEGSAEANLAANAPLAALLRAPSATPARELLRWWLGDPMAIRDACAAELRRQPGSNLLLVGQQQERILGMLASGLLGVAAQCRGGLPAIWLLDGTTADDPIFGFLPGLAKGLGDPVRVLSPRELAEALAELAREVSQRLEDPSREAPPTLLLVHSLQRFRDLRRDEDDYSFSASDAPPKPDRLFAAILREGPTAGVHTIATVDTLANLHRVVDRNALREFDWRVALQMSATDASTLIDSPLASRLGLDRAYLHSEEQGRLEKFRPYPLPSPEFAERVLASLRR
jgi:S-DNA-T family DNA segregation ATPase FtsK/SpoIIIE